MAKAPNWPPFAQRFLDSDASGVGFRAIVSHLHQWMRRRGIGIRLFTAQHGQRLLEDPPPKFRPPKARTRYRKRLGRYLIWLHEQAYLSWDPRLLFGHPVRLGETAKRFLASLKPTLKPSTCRTYRTSLRMLHGWLQQNELSLDLLQREEVARWLQHLDQRELAASTRINMLQNIRRYFDWLVEQQIVSGDPDELIRRSDFPKLPQYLPRPLPPEIDTELQRRFAKSKCLYQFGLLLMRKTGLRIGELIALEYNCVRVAPNKNRALKVPLGKLNTERLVPLTEDTCRFIDRLRRRGPRRRPWLLATPGGAQTRYEHYREALNQAASGLVLSEPLTTHRLRHTFATSLLAGGMSILGIMTLLGHKDHRMTLRYTAITQDTVRKEYFGALQRLQSRYALNPSSTVVATTNPAKLIADVIHWLKHQAPENPNTQKLIKRLRRIQAALRRF